MLIQLVFLTLAHLLRNRLLRETTIFCIRFVRCLFFLELHFNHRDFYNILLYILAHGLQQVTFVLRFALKRVFRRPKTFMYFKERSDLSRPFLPLPVFLNIEIEVLRQIL